MTAYLNGSEDEELAEEDMADLDWLNPTEKKVNQTQPDKQTKPTAAEAASKKQPSPVKPEADEHTVTQAQDTGLTREADIGIPRARGRRAGQ
ncbi:hypothetical protein KCU93_g992, partial [Aureobasidium melanogenum]